ncbi:MAG: hypothetical protein RL338_24 [Chloroflexota bacterium]|jgi:CTP:molybdopterin cytidylyltransferase MocA
MTVAAIVLAPPPVADLRDESGRPLVRSIVDAATAGGAVPVYVVSPDADGSLANALAETDAIVIAPPDGAGPGIAWFAHGLLTALETVGGTSGALLWPGRHRWVDPETTTSLIEAHGVRPDAILRPTWSGTPGFPALVPVRYAAALGGLAGSDGPAALEALAGQGVPVELLDLGDPGATHDAATPRDRLPAYEGPLAPASGHAHEWGSAAAERPDEPA